MTDARSWHLVDLERPWTTNAERQWHYHKRAQIVRDARTRWAWHALTARIPRLDRVEIDAQPLAKDRRWRPDVGACYPSVKAAIDGLVDARVLDDDDDRHVVAVRFLPCQVEGRDGLSLTIREVL